MRYIRHIIIITLAMAASSAMSAQEFSEYPSSNRGADGKIIREGYITNRWYDNWVISAGAGVNSFKADGNSMKLTPDFELSLTKWAMPSLAFRFGIQGYKGKEGYVPDFTNHSPLPYDPSKDIVSWDYFYAHADMMWCATNTFLGYKFRRLYSASPYLTGGYQRMFDPDAFKTNYDREAVIGVGLLNSFRITDRLSLTVDLRSTFFDGRFHDANGGVVTHLMANAGLSYNIYRPGWRRAADLEDALDAAISKEKEAQSRLRESERSLREADEENNRLRDRNKVLENRLNELKDVAAQEMSSGRSDDELLRRIASADLVVYYDINVDRLSKMEEFHIDNYVKDVLERDPAHVFYITGSADKGTGTFEINTRLSNGRVNGVKRYLIRKHGIPEGRIVLKGAIISDKHEDGRLDRCVLFENE